MTSRSIIDRLKEDDEVRSSLARLVGSKGYHAQVICRRTISGGGICDAQEDSDY